MKKISVTAIMTFALASAIGCAKEENKEPKADTPAPAAAKKDTAKPDTAKPAAKDTTPTAVAKKADADKSKLLVLKFHHDS